jgi:hypothetical protein
VSSGEYCATPETHSHSSTQNRERVRDRNQTSTSPYTKSVLYGSSGSEARRRGLPGGSHPPTTSTSSPAQAQAAPVRRTGGSGSDSTPTRSPTTGQRRSRAPAPRRSATKAAVRQSPSRRPRAGGRARRSQRLTTRRSAEPPLGSSKPQLFRGADRAGQVSCRPRSHEAIGSLCGVHSLRRF